jgi:hypothetical protein
MFRNIITKNSGFVQICMSFIVVCFVCLFNGNFVFGQTGDETSLPSFWDWLYDSLSLPSFWDALDTLAPYAAIVGSAIIGPFIVEKWKNHQSIIDQKTKTVAEINELVMKTLVAIMKVEEVKKENKFSLGLKDLKDARDEQYYKEFKVRSHVIQSEIQAYFKGCSKEWNVLIDYVQFVEHLSDKEDSKDRMEIIKDYWDSNKLLSSYEPLEQKIKKGGNIEVFKKLLNDAMEKFNTSHHNAQCKDIEDYKEKLAEKKNAEPWYEIKHAIVAKKNDIVTDILNSYPSIPSRLKRGIMKKKKEKEEAKKIQSQTLMKLKGT